MFCVYTLLCITLTQRQWEKKKECVTPAAALLYYVSVSAHLIQPTIKQLLLDSLSFSLYCPAPKKKTNTTLSHKLCSILNYFRYDIGTLNRSTLSWSLTMQTINIIRQMNRPLITCILYAMRKTVIIIYNRAQHDIYKIIQQCTTFSIIQSLYRSVCLDSALITAVLQSHPNSALQSAVS